MIPLVVAVALAAAGANAGAGGELCGFCHPDVRVEFQGSIHHSEEVVCTSCHGGDPTSDTVPGAHSGSFRKHLRRRDIPKLCASCHADTRMMRPYNLPTDQYALYLTSQHGQELATGDEKVAVCTDCHGVHGILAHDDPRSSVYPRNIPKTCSRCHSDHKLMSSYGIEGDPYADFFAGRHGEAFNARQDSSAPECSRCHGAHGATPPGVGDVNKVCGQCHATARASFLASPHKAGMDAAGLPECSSCHGHHKITKPAVSEMDGLCLQCHEQGSPPAELGLEMKTLYMGASADVDKAEETVDVAKAIPLHVEDYTARLEEAKTSLIEAQTVMHSLDLASVERLTNRARTIGQEVESETHEKIDSLKWRRVGLLVFWFYLIVTVATLVHFRRRAVREASDGASQ